MPLFDHTFTRVRTVIETYIRHDAMEEALNTLKALNQTPLADLPGFQEHTAAVIKVNQLRAKKARKAVKNAPKN